MSSETGKGRTALAAGLILVLFLVAIQQNLIGTVVPGVVAEFNGFDLYAWVMTAYLLAETVVVQIVGKPGDLYGYKWITVAGVFVFLVGSTLRNLAWSMSTLVVFRG